MDLQGGIDKFDYHNVEGWAKATDDGADRVGILVTVDGHHHFRIAADAHRQDLERAGIGDGRYGFVCELPSLSPLVAHTVVMVTEQDGTPLPGTPLLIPAETRWNEELQAVLAKALVDTDSAEQLRHRAGFLAQQAERLLQRASDHAGLRTADASRRYFGARWTGSDTEPGDNPASRMLVISDTLPDERRDRASRVALAYLRSLHRLGYVTQIVPADLAGGPAALALANEAIGCCCLPWAASVEEVLRRDAGRFAGVLLLGGNTVQYIPLARHYQPQARLVYSVGDAAQRWPGGDAPQAGQARTREIAGIRGADQVITHARPAAMRLAGLEIGQSRARYVPWSMPLLPTQAALGQRSGIACVADFRQPAELAAAWWLIREVLPRLRARDPSITCILAGPGMPDALRVAGGGNIGVRPGADEASLLNEVRLTAAPAGAGSGAAIWLTASLAAGVPCVGSAAMGTALGLPSPLDGLCTDDPDSFADICHRLHIDADFNRECRDAGLAFVARELSEVQTDASMAACLPQVA